MTIGKLGVRRKTARGDYAIANVKEECSNRRRPIKVLLVDDEPTYLRIATLFFQTRYRDEITVVGTANGGEECLAKTPLLAPQVILIDLNMPGLSGLQTIPLLRIMFPEIRIIALTLNDGENSRRAVLAAGGNELVSKATMSSDLMPAIRRVMQQDQISLRYAEA
jgi:DNA-binding NarL/FixJ family response regulator